MLPIDLILVRHGQSEGNVAKRLSEQGNHEAMAKLQEKHTRSFRLSEKGREQAINAGKWLIEEFCTNNSGFDRFITSEYVRAMETAGLLDVQGARWYRNFYLTERDWGSLESSPEDERELKYAEAMKMRIVEPFFWRPPNGESMAQVCLRLDRVLQTLHRESSDKKVIIVCHGEVMRGFRVLLERMPQQQFAQSYLSSNDEDRIHNCEIMHYTRRDPNTGSLSPYANWIRRVRPANQPFWESGWLAIERPKYSNQDLLEIVSESQSSI